MSAKTQQFQGSGSNLRSTIQQSINLIRGKDVSNYTLVFIDTTLKNAAGSHENIYMPHITLGRGQKCHVRYSEKYTTVSREHASISTDGNNFYLNHNPKAKNPTLVNGNPINMAYSLQNGDEIQLSYDGPRLRFNASKVKTSTIGLTSRIGGAISQAVKPYKTALGILGLLLIVAFAFAGYNMYHNSQLQDQLLDNQLVIESLTNESESFNEEIKTLEKRGKANSARYNRLVRQKREQDRKISDLKRNPEKIAHYTQSHDSQGNVKYNYNDNIPTGNIDEKKEVDNGKFRGEKSDEVIDNLNLELADLNLLPKSDVVLLIGKRIEVDFQGRKEYIGVKEFYQFDQENPQFEDRDGLVYGSGFYTDKGELITARHVVQPWRFAFKYNMSDIWKELNVLETNGAELKLIFDALSPKGKDHSFDTDNIRIDDSADKIEINAKPKKFKLKALTAINKKFKKFKKLEFKYKSPIENFSDWAKNDYDNVENSKISYSRPKSQKLRTGTDLHLLGYSDPGFLQTSRRKIEPNWTKTGVSQDYTFDGVIHTSIVGFGQGASGGPALLYEDGKFIALGIISVTIGTSNAIIVPLQNVR